MTGSVSAVRPLPAIRSFDIGDPVVRYSWNGRGGRRAPNVYPHLPFRDCGRESTLPTLFKKRD